MNRGDLSGWLRQLKLLYPLDFVRFYNRKIWNYKKNQAFKKKHPEVVLPPDYLLYESYRLDYEKYYLDGLDTAQWLAAHLAVYKKLANLNILDWGCGPGRIIRHLPNVINHHCHFYGTDYNQKTIAWCRENISGVQFYHNQIHPPTAFEEHFFDVIYGISIFTHLSEASHHVWLQELIRISKPGGILFLTLQGDAFKPKLSNEELQRYERGELVVRGKVKEGHRVFTAFHPPQWARAFFADFLEIAVHIPGKAIGEGGNAEQDVWILHRKE